MTASDMVVNIRCNISLEKMNILEISLEMKKKTFTKLALKKLLLLLLHEKKTSVKLWSVFYSGFHSETRAILNWNLIAVCRQFAHSALETSSRRVLQGMRSVYAVHACFLNYTMRVISIGGETRPAAYLICLEYQQKWRTSCQAASHRLLLSDIRLQGLETLTMQPMKCKNVKAKQTKTTNKSFSFKLINWWFNYLSITDPVPTFMLLLFSI